VSCGACRASFRIPPRGDRAWRSEGVPSGELVAQGDAIRAHCPSCSRIITVLPSVGQVPACADCGTVLNSGPPAQSPTADAGAEPVDVAGSDASEDDEWPPEAAWWDEMDDGSDDWAETGNEGEGAGEKRGRNSALMGQRPGAAQPSAPSAVSGSASTREEATPSPKGHPMRGFIIAALAALLLLMSMGTVTTGRDDRYTYDCPSSLRMFLDTGFIVIEPARAAAAYEYGEDWSHVPNNGPGVYYACRAESTRTTILALIVSAGIIYMGYRLTRREDQ